MASSSICRVAAEALKSRTDPATAKGVVDALKKSPGSFGNAVKALKAAAKDDLIRRALVRALRNAKETFSPANAKLGCNLIRALKRLKRANSVAKSKVRFDSNGFPIFKSKFKMMTLPSKLKKASDYLQFKAASKSLVKAIKKKPALRREFTAKQIAQLKKGETPSGFIWHHRQSEGQMQLVDKKTHNSTFHYGGKSIWGGKR